MTRNRANSLFRSGALSFRNGAERLRALVERLREVAEQQREGVQRRRDGAERLHEGAERRREIAESRREVVERQREHHFSTLIRAKRRAFGLSPPKSLIFDCLLLVKTFSYALAFAKLFYLHKRFDTKL